MRITSKGQVAIPIALREKTGLVPNTEVDFELDGQSVRIRRARRRKGLNPGEELIARMRGRAT